MSSGNEIIDYPEIKSYEGGPVPTFLKIVYVGFTIFAFTYFFMYFAGDGSPLVQAYNALCGGH
jgi:hypothetical protein